jgi:hypothetical protein
MLRRVALVRTDVSEERIASINRVTRPSYGMLRRVVLVRTDVSKELIASINRVAIIGELGTLAVTSNRSNVVPTSPILVTPMMKAIRSSETSVLTRATRHKIPEDGILHSHRCQNRKSYIALTDWTL